VTNGISASASRTPRRNDREFHDQRPERDHGPCQLRDRRCLRRLDRDGDQGQQHLLLQDRRPDINRAGERQLHSQPGYIPGDHTNGFYVNGGTEPLTIENNTIFINQVQTDTINLDAGSSGVLVANKTSRTTCSRAEATPSTRHLPGQTPPRTSSSRATDSASSITRGAASTVPAPTSPHGRATSGRATSWETHRQAIPAP